MRHTVLFHCSTIYAYLVQWIDSSLSRSEEIEFFHDEFRCPVYIKDVVNVILALTKKWISDGNQIKLILNVGGPDRLSRAQMAVAVADYRGYDLSLIKLVSAASKHFWKVFSDGDGCSDIY
ncbi:hypothetical protein IEQ34_008303 [Dendrobium chrysotoxum]|uniref:Uncharacterized protein n=1 Tax=Dendrobium chrysotoxum TaxID=161865 RepID=A0AAV7GYI2_DENCH|nr:hypothetical protein IEQ34_008303 [Dendrobium chrysotoxum]